MNKKQFTEADIRTKFITPALTGPGQWDLLTQLREECYFTKGRVIVRGKAVKRGEAKLANEGFTARAPEAVVAKEREKLAAWMADRAELAARLAGLRGD